jgi:hypothetical protein
MRCALHEPLPPAPPAICQLPDIEFPDTDPEYVMTVEPTVPNVMWLPLTDPFKGVVPDVERSIVPDSCDPV